MDKNKTFCSEYSEHEYYDEYESLSNIENNESLESLFELDFNMLTSAKILAQQNISEDDDQEGLGAVVVFALHFEDSLPSRGLPGD